MSQRTLLNLEEPGGGYKGPLLLAAGHRPFFLLAGLYATAGMGFWLASLMGWLALSPTWHGHEMIFGFAAAAITGFMMAAVPKWTSAKPTQGLALGILVGLWLVGRVAVHFEAFAWLDLGHLLFLAVLVGRMIFGSGNKRNFGVPVLVLVLAGLNGLYHFHDPGLALRAGAVLILALIVLIGGRIIPAFTQNALRMAYDKGITCTTPRWLDRLAIPVMLLVVILEVAAPETVWSGGVSLAAAAVLLARMLGWQTLKTFRIPLVWVLHAGYLWLPVGFALKGLSIFGVLDNPTAALHALTAGGIGTMILAVGSRAALGHSGRPLVASPATVLSYVLVLAAAVLRVFVDTDWALTAAGLSWTLGWGVFCVAYWPVLAHPRIDGKPD